MVHIFLKVINFAFLTQHLYLFDSHLLKRNQMNPRFVSSYVSTAVRPML